MLVLRGTSVLLVLATASALPARPPRTGRSYERWVSPKPLGATERQLLQVVRRWSRARGASVRPDARLHRAARAVLPHVPLGAGERIDVDSARAAAQRWGWTDGQLSAVALRLPRRENVRYALRQRLSADLRNIEVTHAGVAARAHSGHTTVVLLLSRRLVDLVPIPSRVRAGRKVRIAGTLRVAAESLTLVLEQPDGDLRRMPLDLGGRAFERMVRVGSDRGSVRAQLLIERGGGPEIAAAFPIGVGKRTGEAETTDIEPVVGTADPQAAEAVLIGLILGTRQARGIPLPTQSVWLQDAARAHATDMQQNGFFAHVSPNSGDLTDRLRIRGVRYVHARENIAIADSAEAAFEQWMQSPSHRANLLEPSANTVGVGVRTSPTATGLQVYTVMVLARLADSAASTELASRAHARINRQRQRLGLGRLLGDETLDRLAERHSREIAWGGAVAETSPLRGHIVDTVFSQADVQEAAADVFRAASIDVVERSPHVAGRFTRVGVGVHRNQGELWVTVIYASD